MATYENTDPNPSLAKDIIIRDLFTGLPKDIIYNIILRLPCKTLLQLRSVSKSCMTLISSPDLIDPHLFKSNDGVFSRLPKVIMYDIFLRLGVETLLRLKSVSKSWLSLISDSDFVKTHLIKSTNDPQFTRHHLLVSSSPFLPNGEHDTGARLYLESLSLHSLLNEPDTETIRHDPDPDFSITRVVGCSNGLVCLASGSRAVFLWNPSTGESRRLPKFIPAESKYLYAYGFCYDESNDDFKVYSIFSGNKVSVYSSKTDRWRMIVDFPYAVSLYLMYYKGMFANEAMHWVFKRDWGSKIKIIVSLDIRTETFEEVLPPVYGQGACRWKLGTFDKSLSFCNFESTHVDIWVLKKCGGGKSWTKLFTMAYGDRPTWFSRVTMYPNIDRHVNLDRPTQLSLLKPITIRQNGDLIMMLNSHIQLYNSKDNAYKELFNRGEGYDHSTEEGHGFNCDVDTYVESLISPMHV